MFLGQLELSGLDAIKKRHAAEAESALLGRAKKITGILVVIRVSRNSKEKVFKEITTTANREKGCAKFALRSLY
jgi:DNA integrity scanning protein DisA with diadenylate cyclase activity